MYWTDTHGNRIIEEKFYRKETCPWMVNLEVT